MPQPIKRAIKSEQVSKTKLHSKGKYPFRRNHPKYGTSKLEDKFAHEFLDKLGVYYERQFKANEIGRYYDFLVEHEILIEVDGDYYHGKDLVYENMNPMQKRNHKVDEIKNKWANEHKYILLRIWENDINNNPTKVFQELKKVLDKKVKKDDKKKRH